MSCSYLSCNLCKYYFEMSILWKLEEILFEISGLFLMFTYELLRLKDLEINKCKR